MSCSSPPPLTDDQLNAAMDGDADSEIAAHLESCRYCQSRLDTLQQLDKQLTQSLFLWDAPDSDALADYVMGLSNTVEAEKIEHYLQISPTAREEVAQLRDFLGQAETIPEEVQSRFKMPQLQLPKLPHPEEIIAQILPPAMTPALRGNDDGRLTAEGKGATVFLEILSTSDGFTLTGEVVAQDAELWEGALVQILRDHDLIASTTLDDMGDFTLERLPSGTFTLQIRAEQSRMIVIHDIELVANV